MKNDLVSVIVPIYNAEKTIQRCVESIQNQSYRNIEIILINDGSKDSSLKLCEEFAQSDERIIVIDIVNSGVAEARNKGILRAQGVYCCFVDSDDWIGSKYVENLVKAICKDNADCVIQGYIKEIDGHMVKNHLKEQEYCLEGLNDSSVVTIFADGYIHPCWNKLFKLELLRIHGLLFKQDVHISEDSMFCIKYLSYCKKITVIDEITYHYCVSSQNMSLSKRVYDNIFGIYELVYRCLEQMLISVNCELKLKEEILIQTLYPQYYVSTLKILRDKNKTYWEKKRILDDMLVRLKGRYILENAKQKTRIKAEKIVIMLILARKYRLIGGLLRWMDGEK